ncbi:hybrid-cluster NAD(P)-dependent oxidoreductase [Paracoccus yeei]|uniref:hybrid-cluster NAD(P)-dependent oxidoreductase n=1 Tax=Paracoccus yeei TaxID=147645 RepID=UPI000EA1E4C7|nr:hybrid-cluster NAD(P)-dependent oxidoreductase [Paracoccus yeei]
MPADRGPRRRAALLCVDIQEETHDVKSFTFVSPQGKQFAFRAGQYFRFQLDPDDPDGSRCYSISSSPLRANAITVTVKRVAGGRVSNWMHDRLQAGTRVKGIGPSGDFVHSSADRLLLLSAGSGITPVMSMLREMVDRAQPVDAVFLHACRSPRDIVFRAELMALIPRLKGMRLHILPESVDGERGWPGLSGRISRDYLALVVPDLAQRHVLCCGPEPFMAAVEAMTRDMGLPPARFLRESFGGVEKVDLPAATAPGAEGLFQVQFLKQGKTIEIGADQTVLSCARKASVRIPSSCANGVCGTCKSKLVKGSVDMNHAGGIRQREIDAGFFLPCCSRPRSDLVIER